MATITGTSGSDTLSGTANDDQISALGGNDTINMSAGNDTVDGGSGFDTLSFSGFATTGVVVDMGAGSAGSTSFTSIERIIASGFADQLTGSAGSDNLTARGGDDILDGAGGNDTLWGEGGADDFLFTAIGAANADNIRDFASGTDHIVLNASVMTALGAEGEFSAGDIRFRSGAGLNSGQDADDRVIYNTTTRQLWYDADGSGSGAAQLIATLQSGATLVATDIIVEGEGTPPAGPTEGDDHLVGTAGDDRIDGLGGNDTIDGLEGNDTLIGGLGQDRLVGGDGNDYLDGLDHEDPSTEESDILEGGLGDDTYVVDFMDTITADTGGTDTVIAFETDWTLGAGLDNLDLLDFGGAPSGTGNELDNVILSGSSGGTLLGLGGNDTLVLRNAQNPVTARGGDGNDTLDAGSKGILFGDGGADVFLFNEDPTASTNEIGDFATGVDTIRLDASVMQALGVDGRFVAGDARFAANSSGTAEDASDRIIYNTSNGVLWYDADGTGGETAEAIATLSIAPSLAATDIEVINGSDDPPPPTGEHIVGTNGSDTLTDTPGNDTIEALGGNDTIVIAHGGDDTIDGGSGYDSISFYGQAPEGVVFDFGNGRTTNVERLLTDSGDDHLIGAAGSQNLSGVAGNDILEGRAGNDTLWGGTGADRFVFRETGTTNADSIRDFASGTDKVVLDASVMVALGATGNFSVGDDRFHAAAGATGGADAEDRVIYNTTTRQFFYDPDGSGSGSAQLLGTLQSGATLAATDIVVEGGGPSNVPTEGDDHLVGTAGDDTIDGLGGNDTIEGLGGNDVLVGGRGDDTLEGGDGDDSLNGGLGADVLRAGAGNDTLDGGYRDPETGEFDVQIDTMDGGTGNDEYHVRDSGEVLIDAGGVDTVFAHDMNWTLAPGFENLTIHNDVSESPFFFGIGNELDNRMVASYAGATLEGRGGNDTLLGASANGGSQLFGGDGDDSLVGSSRRDVLDGGAGNDTLAGHGDFFDEGDVFVFSAPPGAANADVVSTFLSSRDTIQLDGSVMGALGASGDFTAGDARFAANSSGVAQDSSDRVVYNTTSGELWYDADGNGATAALLIATLNGAPGLVATDIAVVNGSEGSVITGTPGDDTLDGTPGDDTIDGLAGNDLIRGDEGNDHLIGGDGNDVIHGGSGNDIFDGGPGDDLLTSGGGLGSSDRGEAEHFIGGEGNDTIIGSTLGTMDGGPGHDFYEIYGDAGSGPFTLIDSGGIDTIYIDADWTLGPDFENLIGRPRDGGNGWAETYLNLSGNDLDNTIDGRLVGGILRGGAGDDTVLGSSWAGSEIDGGTGNDTLQGGAGGDRFVFAEQPGDANADSVVGFTSGSDKLALHVNAHAGIGASGQFASGDPRFLAAAGASGGQDPSDRVIYDTTTGQLWYDADGSGTGAAQLVGTLQGAPLLVATDVEVLYTANQHIVGTEGDDVLSGGDGDDLIEGFGGNDVLTGGLGEDVLRGGEGDDILDARDRAYESGDDEADTLDGGLGNDVYHVASEVDTVLPDPGGVDWVIVHANWSLGINWTLGPGLDNLELLDGFSLRGIGNELDNFMRDWSGGHLSGLAGNDHLVVSRSIPGSGNTGIAFGGDGDDMLFGVDANSALFGDAGNDVLDGSDQVGTHTTMGGGAGSDRFVLNHAPNDLITTSITDFASGADKIVLDAIVMPALGTSGNFAPNDDRFHAAAGASGGADSEDRIVYNTTTGELFYDADGSGAEAAQLIATLSQGPSVAATDVEVINGSSQPGEHIVGTNGSDTLTDTPGNDTIEALGGNDTIVIAHGGEDTIDGGDGYDSISFYGQAPEGMVFDFGNGRTSNVERLLADSGDDHLIGASGSQNLSGVAGNDTLEGREGNDILWGGTGEDTFVFREFGAANADTIRDWGGGDSIALDNEVMAALGADGDFAAGDARFVANSSGTAQDASDRVVYDTSSGELYYDADGNGAGAAQLIATISGAPGLAASDIAVI